MHQPITLFCDYGCPFAQRIEAVLTHHGVRYSAQIVDSCDLPSDLLRLSPTGRIPLVTIGGRPLYEAAVVSDFFAEQLGWRDAYPASLEGRALHRIAIRRLDAMWEAFAIELTRGSLPAARIARIDEDLDAMERTIAEHPADQACMLVFTAVPFWLRWEWMGTGTTLTARIRERPALHAWLSAGARLPTLLATTPDAELTRQTHACAG